LELLHELRVNAVAYLAVAVLALAALAWLRIGDGRWLPLARLRRGAWSGGEVLLLILVYRVISSLVVVALDQLYFFNAIFGEDVSIARKVNIGAVLFIPLVFALHLALLHGASKTHPRHLGLTLSRWRGNAAVGIVGFLAATPVVLLVYAALSLVTSRQDQDIQKLARDSLTIVEWAILVVSAVVLAAVVEEWIFRGLLQGWLRRASLLGHGFVALWTVLLGANSTLVSLAESWEGKDVEVVWGPLLFAVVVAIVYVIGVARIWRPVLRGGLAHFAHAAEPMPGEAGDQPPVELPLPALGGPQWQRFQHANARWAVVGSAMMFAVFHPWWPAQPAIFLLGLVLGWLAYRTQNLVPGIVLHALFNLVACLVLIYSVSTGANGNDATTALRPASGGATVNSVPGS
jgi:membrane protease YdiL (CAAX protease family)